MVAFVQRLGFYSQCEPLSLLVLSECLPATEILAVDKAILGEKFPEYSRDEDNAVMSVIIGSSFETSQIIYN